MPPNGDMCMEHDPSPPPAVAVRIAIKAKVGAAANDSQSVAPKSARIALTFFIGLSGLYVFAHQDCV